MMKYTAFLSRTVLGDGVSLGCILASLPDRELTEYIELAPLRFTTESRMQDAIDRASSFGHSSLMLDTDEPIDVTGEQLRMLGFTKMPT